MAAWKTGHRPGTTPQQWAMARVNSYIGKGKGTYHGADKDLREEMHMDDKDLEDIANKLTWEDIVDFYNQLIRSQELRGQQVDYEKVKQLYNKTIYIKFITE